MAIFVEWGDPNKKADLWHLCPSLYCYFIPEKKNKIVYIGQCSGTTPWSRLRGSHKKGVFRDIAKQFELGTGELEIVVGEISCEGRFTKQMLADVESLLIYREKPWGNIQSRESRIQRPGLSVSCEGLWHGKRTKYIDR